LLCPTASTVVGEQPEEEDAPLLESLRRCSSSSSPRVAVAAAAVAIAPPPSPSLSASSSVAASALAVWLSSIAAAAYSDPANRTLTSLSAGTSSPIAWSVWRDRSASDATTRSGSQPAASKARAQALAAATPASVIGLSWSLVVAVVAVVAAAAEAASAEGAWRIRMSLRRRLCERREFFFGFF
jgi:hypothetical protein